MGDVLTRVYRAGELVTEGCPIAEISEHLEDDETVVLSGVRVSSGALKSLLSTPGMSVLRHRLVGLSATNVDANGQPV